MTTDGNSVVCENESVPRNAERNSGVRSRSKRFLALHLHLSLSRRAQVVSLFFLVGAGALVPWTVFLGLTLPPRYDADHWRFLWTGFDAGLIAVLLLAAWAAWYRRQILAAISMVAGTLLFCDAWFDMVTSFGHRDEWLTMLTGFGAELPLGIFFFWLYRRMALATMSVLSEDASTGPRPKRLRDYPIIEAEREVLGLDSDERRGP